MSHALAPSALIPPFLDVDTTLGDPIRVAAVAALAQQDPSAFDHLAALTATVLRGDVAYVSLLGATEQNAIGASGGSATTWPIGLGCCGVTMALGAPLLLGELRRESSPYATALRTLGFKAYARATIRVDGERVGTLCVLDRHERAWSLGDAQRLVALAELAGHLLRG